MGKFYFEFIKMIILSSFQNKTALIVRNVLYEFQFDARAHVLESLGCEIFRLQRLSKGGHDSFTARVFIC